MIPLLDMEEAHRIAMETPEDTPVWIRLARLEAAAGKGSQAATLSTNGRT